MSGPVRLAGWGRVGDTIVTWTVAEGRRGRRWREVVTREDAIVHSLLLETDTERRFSHLELSVAGALVTLHPEGDGTLHGNRVGRSASVVDHVVGQTFGWDTFVLVEGSRIAAAAMAWALARSMGSGSVIVSAVVVDRAGRVGATGSIEVQRVDETGWRIGGGDAFDVDGDGIPALVEGRREPLET
jgi:hypothetical protein